MQIMDKKEKKEGGIGGIIALFLPSLLACFILIFVLKPTVISGHSMERTFQDKDYLFLNKLAYITEEPNRGDIIVFKAPEITKDLIVKRIIAVGGDHVSVQDGVTQVNGIAINENYIKESFSGPNVDRVIPEGSFFVMGDNRNYSLDSRFSEMGLVEKNQIVGKALIRVYPFNNITIIK